VKSHEPLNPDIVYSGKDSTIVGIQASTEDSGFGRPKTVWNILAKSKVGSYFILRYVLCDYCDIDASNLKSNRIFTGVDAMDFRILSVDEAKNWLYRAGFKKEFKAEFGADAPPTSVQLPFKVEHRRKCV